MVVRLYQRQDTLALARLFTETVRSINAADYPPEQLAAWAPDPPSAEYWRKQLDGHLVFVAEHDLEIVGFATFESDGHLDHLYVHHRFNDRE